MSAGMPGSYWRQKKHLTVWNWHGDTNHVGELIPRVVYGGPEKNYCPGNPGQRGRHRK